MQNSGFPTCHNIFHVSLPNFDVQKWRTLVLCCRSAKTCSFLRQFRVPLARKFTNIFNFLRNFLDATFCRRNGLKWKIIGQSLYRGARRFSAAPFYSRTMVLLLNGFHWPVVCFAVYEMYSRPSARLHIRFRSCTCRVILKNFYL